MNSPQHRCDEQPQKRHGHLVVLTLIAASAVACVPTERSGPSRVVDIATPAPQAAPSPPSPPSTVAPADPIRDAAPLLEDGIQERERRRARLATVGDGFWSLDLAEAGQPSLAGTGEAVDEWPSEMVVAERHANHLRVVHEGGDLRVTFYLRLSDFHEVTERHATMLGPSGEPFRNGCGVTLPPGTIVAAHAARLGLRSLVHRSDWLEARGKLPSEVIDRVYEAPAPVAPSGTNCTVKGPVTVLDAPRGEVVAKLAADRSYACNRRGAVVAGSQQIAIREDGVSVVGYAPEAQVTTELDWSTRGGSGTGAGWGRTHTKFIYLWPHDAVYPRDSLGLVGRVLKRALMAIDEGVDDDGMQLIRLPIYPWDFIGLRVDAQTGEAAHAKYTAWYGRVRFTHLVVSGTGTTASVTKELEYKRTSAALCYDYFLKSHPRTPQSYQVDMTFAPSHPPPVFANSTGQDTQLVSCLKRTLTSINPALHATRATFTLELSPSDLID